MEAMKGQYPWMSVHVEVCERRVLEWAMDGDVCERVVPWISADAVNGQRTFTSTNRHTFSS